MRRAPLALTAVLVALGAATPAGASGPETCVRHTNDFALGESEICLINPPTATEPWAANQTIQMRVPAETDQLRVTWRNSDEPEYNAASLAMQPLTQGPPGGTSIWQGAISSWLGTSDPASLPRDGTLIISAEYWFDAPPPAYSNLQGTVTFADLPVLGLVNGITESLRRRGKRYVAVYSANARAAASAKVRLYIWATNTEGLYETPGRRTTGTSSTSGGILRAVAKLSRRYVRKKCRSYRHCSVIAEGFLQMDGLTLGSNLGFTRQLKVK